MITFEQLIDDVKNKADLVEVIEATSEYKFERRIGRYTKCKHPDSLMVDSDWGIYTWFSKPGQGGHTWETGDAFHWLTRYHGKTFAEALEWLAERYNVRIPDHMSKQDPEQAKRERTRAELYEIACTWLEEQLWKTPAAIQYCMGRGWTEETIRSARLGFSPGYEKTKDLIGTLQMHEVNLDDPAAVSLVGRRGDVATWLQKAAIKDHSPDWLDNNLIPGLVGAHRLVYPHIWRGRVSYFSARNLEWSGDALVNRREVDEKGSKRPKSYNQPASLVGERVRYFNHLFRSGVKNCLVVEGQPDAISAAQLGVPAVALVGVAADADLADYLTKKLKIECIYVGLDNDKAGQENQIKTASVFGPMTRLVQWPSDETEHAETGDQDASAQD